MTLSEREGRAMATKKIPFHYGLFYNAMVGLLGREPDTRILHGDDGYYHFRYTPKNKAEEIKFQDSLTSLSQWLQIFDIQPIYSRCDYGLLLNPKTHGGKAGQNYLEIKINHDVPPKKSKLRK